MRGRKRPLEDDSAMATDNVERAEDEGANSGYDPVYTEDVVKRNPQKVSLPIDQASGNTDNTVVDVMKRDQSANPTIDTASANKTDKTVLNFFTAPAITERYLEEQGPQVEGAVEQVVELMETKGAEVYLEYRKRKQERAKSLQTSKKKEDSTVVDTTAGIESDPRSYQTALLEIARKQNTIVHLGTGTGKTLIAQLLIKEFMEEPCTHSGEQVVFLVPSVALALQQTATIAANLPYTVEGAHGATISSPGDLKRLARSDILVVTHGLCLELLSHYGDLFSVKKWKLLILDECHNCLGNSSYVNIMKTFYHETAPADRPRVLGLTASPLINVKKNPSDEQLREKLELLEETLDSKIASLENLDISEDDEHRRLFLEREAQEKIVKYNATPPPPISAWPSLDDKDRYPMHEIRRKEFRKFVKLFEDVGPYPLILYARELLEDLSSPHFYEEETVDQLLQAKLYLRSLIAFCEKQGHMVSNKVAVLEELLQKQLIGDRSSAGVVFVQRRITALALNLYFKRPNDEAQMSTEMSGSMIAGEKEPFMLVEEILASPGPLSLGPAGGAAGCDDDQFGDAEPEDDPSTATICHGLHQKSKSGDRNKGLVKSTLVAGAALSSDTSLDPVPKQSHPSWNVIRCGVLVRQPRQLFKSISFGGDSKTEEDLLAKEEWIHQERDIRKMINALRSGDINVLVATSVVEEGVDVQACSFVVVLDGLQTVKGYIQMKGRARQEKATFFVFENQNADNRCASPLSLRDAKAMETRLRRFIATQTLQQTKSAQRLLRTEPEWSDETVDESTDQEIKAVREGFFGAAHGKITLGSAQSLLYRFSLRQPMDPVVRCSRISLQAHLPLYDNSIDVLQLPAFIESSLRTVRLPTFCLDKSKKERKRILALMACVRLHQKDLLTDRLLPLSKKDIRQRIQAVTENSFGSFEPIERRPIVPSREEGNSRITFYQYQLRLDGQGLEQARLALKTGGSRFALLTEAPLENTPTFHQHHPEFGKLTCSLDAARVKDYSSEEASIISDFFALVLNARWKRRSNDAFFRPRTSSGHKDPDIIVGLINQSGTLDFAGMQILLDESKRAQGQKIAAVQSIKHTGPLPQPRLWCPVYAEHSVCIVYGATDKTCNSEFPFNNAMEHVKTYKDYFKHKWGKEVPGEAPLYVCQRVWKQPRTSLNDPSVSKQRDQPDCGGYFVCQNLTTVFLPKEVCMEAPFLANTAVALEAVILPQLLYFLERRLAAKAFIHFCVDNFPELGRCLRIAKRESVLELLSAQSCSEVASYERLEWLGDAVLQLVQTDAVLKSTDLRDWVSSLHEGDLDSVRSIMCSNARLTSSCDAIGLGRFILTKKLEKGLWVPSALELFSETDGKVDNDAYPSEKVRADFIEAILAFVYKSDAESGYAKARMVAKELRITIPWSDIATEKENGEWQSRAKNLVKKTKDLTGYDNFRNVRLLEEAFSHPTDLNVRTSSYQRLEWIGDAVLCLAVREWVFSHYPEAEPGKMVLLETPLVANSSLAFLCLKYGLHKLLSHRDQTLPGRIESYSASVLELGRGLFSTDPPKCIADIVESLLGAVYIDGGWHAARQAALNVVSPIMDLYQSSRSPEDFNYHPRRRLMELGGDFVSLSTYSEQETGQVVATVDLLGFQVTSATALTEPAATDRSAAIVLAVFEKNAELMHRFVEGRRRMLSAASKLKTQEGKASKN